MLKVKNGDLDKLGLLFERYYRSMFSYFYRFTRRSQESEDLVQTLFERILRYRHTYTGEDPFRPWIYAIARNLCRDEFHKDNSRLEEFDSQIERFPAAENQNDDDSDHKKHLLKEAISRLDESKRDVLILSRYEGLRYSEIAKITGQTEGAVKVKIFRALNDIRETVNMISKTE